MHTCMWNSVQWCVYCIVYRLHVLAIYFLECIVYAACSLNASIGLLNQFSIDIYCNWIYWPVFCFFFFFFFCSVFGWRLPPRQYVDNLYVHEYCIHWILNWLGHFRQIDFQLIFRIWMKTRKNSFKLKMLSCYSIGWLELLGFAHCAFLLFFFPISFWHSNNNNIIIIMSNWESCNCIKWDDDDDDDTRTMNINKLKHSRSCCCCHWFKFIECTSNMVCCWNGRPTILITCRMPKQSRYSILKPFLNQSVNNSFVNVHIKRMKKKNSHCAYSSYTNAAK